MPLPLLAVLLSILRAKQPKHLCPRKRDVRDGSSSTRNRTRVVDEFDLSRAATCDLQNSAAGVLRLRNHSHHGIHNFFHRNPLALADPAFARCPERRQNTPRSDCDDSHALGGLHRRHGLDEVVDGGFGSGVQRDCGSGLLGGGGADHHYCAAGVEAGESVESQLGAADWVVEVDF